MFNKKSKIYIAGHTGLVGSAIIRKLNSNGFTNLLYRTSQELDLRNTLEVEHFMQTEKPEFVFLAAGRVGGIRANIDSPAEFLYDNTLMQINVIHQSFLAGVKKILILGSSCIYPTVCKQPMKEEYLMNGRLEPTNEGYALSKIVALKMGELYKRQYGFNAISAIPCNLYGFNDSFDPINSHVLSATVKKFVDAVTNKERYVKMWGSGKARREFMNVEDMAECCLFLMENYNEDSYINIGWGEDVSISQLASLVAKHTNFKGDIIWDTTQPDGMLRKCLDVSRMKSMGYFPKIGIETGVKQMVDLYKLIKK